LDPEALERRFHRERKARKAAEKLLEEKSLELYNVNKQLATNAVELEQQVTEQAQQLYSNELRTSTILKSALDAIVTVDNNSIILEFNPAATKLFGYEAREVIGMPMAEYLLPEPARADFYRVMEHYKKTGKEEVLGRLIELVVLNKQGVEVDVEVAITKIDIADRTYFTAFLRDITQRKLSEKLIVEAKEQAESASKAKGEFLAVMSHEIRTPINAILGSITILKELDHSDEQARYLKIADEAGNSLQALINDILDFSKIDAGKLELESVEFDPVQFVEETVGILSQRIFEKGIEVACYFDMNLPSRIMSDQAKVRQILLNLLSNALKFTKEGGIMVSIRAAGEKLKFSVCDSGIGISGDNQNKLFNQFTQADSSTQRKYGGTGLGLAISSRLAKLLGGEIGVESEEGVGSHFWFTIQPDSFSEKHPAEHKYKAESAKIYESNSATQNALALQLDNMGISVEKISNEPGELSQIVFSGSGSEWRFILSYDKTVESSDKLLFKPVHIYDLQRAANDYLPANEQSHPQPEDEVALQAGVKRRLLLAEDSQANQLVATTFLKSAGYDVDAVADGKEAVDAVRNFNYDLVLMDVSMPEMDGIEATKLIRKLPGENGRVTIVALTANVFKDDIERCYDAGMNAFVPKPIDKKHLLKSIGELLTPTKV
jgi:PAS domain S-box-containing protein